MREELFLRQQLRDYYNSTEINSVPDISTREFGIGDFGRKISSRHLTFKNNQDLNSYLREKNPFYISYSNARYEFPDARPMEKKNLLNADLIYEFDADDIQTDCKINHDSWKCPSCNAVGKGNVEKCTCGSGVKIEEWVCPECIGETKKQTKELLELLENDFGFSKDISINFSGSKGFHVHIRSEGVQKLSKTARLELLDYITATNLNFEYLGFVSTAKNVFRCPKKSTAKGWAKKLLDGIEGILKEGDAVTIASNTSREGYNVTKSMAEKLLKEKPRILDGMEKGFLINVPGIRVEKFWLSMLSYIASEEKLFVDRQTSIDINKIIRVPDTIHGSTGLIAKQLELNELKNFDALKECVVLGENETKIQDANAPKFYLNGKWFGPYDNEEVSIPNYAVFYLLARGSAVLEEAK